MSWRIRAAVLALLAGGAGACSSDENTGSPAAATGGTSHDGGGAPNGGSNGSGGVSGGAAGATGGAAGRAGAVSGGAAGMAGGGGMTATGGNAGTAGAPSSGGTSGTGGAPADAGGAPGDGGTCAPSVDTSCLGQFFVQANQCFHPSGTCVVQTASNGNHICWSNGAKLILNGGPNGRGFTFSQDGTLCFYGSWSGQNGVPSSYTFTLDGGDLLVYEPPNGKTTCLDQTQTTIATDFGHCTSITSLLALDDTGCAQGTCN